MNKRWTIVGIIVIMVGSGYLFYGYWKNSQLQRTKAEEQFTQQKQRAEKIVQEKQQAHEAMDAHTLENVRIVDALVKKYFEKAGYVPSMVGDLSLVGQGLGWASAPRSGESAVRLREVLYTWKGGNSYELCADFKTDNLSAETTQEWKHKSGNYCFQRSLGSSVIDEIKTSL